MMRALLFLAAWVAGVPAAHAQGAVDVPDCSCGEIFDGHFTDARKIGQVRLCARPAASEWAEGFCKGGFSRRRLFDTLWTFEARNDAHAPYQRLAAVEGVLNRYDAVRLAETCRDPDTGLDQLLFAAAYSGSANGSRRDAVFVRYDPGRRRFAAHVVNADYVGNDCSLKHAEARRAERMALRRAGERLHAALWSLALKRGPFRARLLPAFSRENLRALFADWNRKLESEPRWRGVADVPFVQPRFSMATLAENRRWRILAVRFIETSRTSWGVLLAHDARHRRWFSFYEVPRGSDKRLLFQPRQVTLKGNRLLMHLCRECEGWGSYFSVNMNLDVNLGRIAGGEQRGRRVRGDE